MITPVNGVESGISGGGTTDVPLTTVAAVSEDSVHLLTAVGFPPPALLHADPGRNWTLNDFQKPGRPTTTYSVTDEADYTDDWATAEVPPPEPEATTAADDGQRLTEDGEAVTTAIADDREHDDDDVGETTASRTTTAALSETPAHATATETNGPLTGHYSPPRPVYVHQHDAPAGWPVRQTVVAYYLHRGRYPAAVVERPHQTIALSFRPVRAPSSSAGFRFPDVDRSAMAGNPHRSR